MPNATLRLTKLRCFFFHQRHERRRRWRRKLPVVGCAHRNLCVLIIHQRFLMVHFGHLAPDALHLAHLVICNEHYIHLAMLPILQLGWSPERVHEVTVASTATARSPHSIILIPRTLCWRHCQRSLRRSGLFGSHDPSPRSPTQPPRDTMGSGFMVPHPLNQGIGKPTKTWRSLPVAAIVNCQVAF